MKVIDIDTGLLPVGKRADAWRALLHETFGPMHVETLRDEAPRAALRCIAREALSFNAMHYRGMGNWRKPIDVAQLKDEYYTLTCPSGAVLQAVQEGTERRLTPGRIYLVNHAVTYRTFAQQEYRTFSVAFPANRLRDRLGGLETFYDLSALCADGLGAQLIASFTRHLMDGATTWSDHAYATLTDQLFDQLALFIQSAGTAATSAESSTREGHRQRALRFIEKNAGDPELSPGRVAQACGISLPYLHGVFRAAGGMSVEQQVFEVRLEMARRLLIHPGKRGIPIATLAYESGFCDPAHFSRSFKRRFGMTPGELRQSAGRVDPGQR